jgi:MFS family permease
MNKEITREEIKQRLIQERRTRITIMALLLSALIFTVIYGTIYDPSQYTFSKIGNRFDPALRYVFIVWASYLGFVIQATIFALFTLENYHKKSQYVFILLGSIFLVLTACFPSLDHLVFWTWMHLLAGFLFALFVTLGFIPFIRYIARENPRLRKSIYIWLGIIWGVSISLYLVFGNTGLFEIFFFTTFLVFLLYISLHLFEEQIIKRSFNLLQGYEDLNQGIEDIFIVKKIKELTKTNK